MVSKSPVVIEYNTASTWRAFIEHWINCLLVSLIVGLKAYHSVSFIFQRPNGRSTDGKRQRPSLPRGVVNKQQSGGDNFRQRRGPGLSISCVPSLSLSLSLSFSQCPASFGWRQFSSRLHPFASILTTPSARTRVFPIASGVATSETTLNYVLWKWMPESRMNEKPRR